MASKDDSFWVDVFRKSPLIGTCMAICGVIGLGLGILFFGDITRLRSIRLVLCLIFSTTCGGIFVGLIIGVVVDTIINAIRDDKKRKRNPRRERKRDWD